MPNIKKSFSYERDVSEIFKDNIKIQKDNSVFEIRIFGHGRFSGHFTPDEEGFKLLIQELKKRRLLNKNVAIYQTLQRIRSDVIPEKNINKLFSSYEPGYYATKDSDITDYNYILIDVDPEHKANTEATDEEVKKAEEIKNKILFDLKECGFNEPTVCFSGNGFHILCRIDVPNTKDNVAAIKEFLKVLSDRYSTMEAKVDVVVYNPSRITKFYGCWSCKGDNTQDRPHRQSRIIQVGDNRPNDFQLIMDYISAHGTSSQKSKRTKNIVNKKIQEETTSTNIKFDEDKKKYLPIIDVATYLEKNDIPYKIIERDGFIIYQLFICPFNDEHNRGECALIEVAGKGVCFHCFHNSCADKTIFDFIKLYPCSKISPVDSNGKIENIFNLLVVNGKMLRDKQGDYYYYYNRETYPLYSDEFRSLIRKLYFEFNKAIPDINLDTKIIKQLETYLLYEDCYIEAAIGKRLVVHNNCLYYALSKNSYVIVSEDGCSISDTTPDDVFFISSNLEKQTVPDFNSKPEDLPDLLLNICNVDDIQIPLLLTNLLSFFREDINSPILVLKGSRGSCKSSCERIIKNLVNPEKSDIISFPEKEDALVAALSNNDLCAFDNVERISENMSAKLCLAVTNGYTTKRKLYSDNTEISICIRSNIIMTCIDDVVSKSDLAERSNVIHLERVEQYRTEAEIKRLVKEIKPKLLGSIFNTLSVIFATANTIEVEQVPRMADFVFFAMAGIKAIGLDEKSFLNLYTNNIAESVSTCVENDPLIICIENLLAKHNGYIDMEPSQLLNEINTEAERLNIKIRKYNPSVLSRSLNSKSADLQAKGINFKREKSSKRTIVLERIPDSDFYNELGLEDVS